MKFKGFFARCYSSPAAKNKSLKKIRKDERRRRRSVAFICHICKTGFKAFPKCKFKDVFCSSCGYRMFSRRGFFCELNPELTSCDYCGCCETGTDEDFDRYAVQVQNGEGYYDASGTYVSYHIDDDDYWEQKQEEIQYD